MGGGESWVEKTEHFLCLCINAENVTFFLLNINQNIFFYLHMQDVYLHIGGFLLPPAVWVYLSSCSLLWYLGIGFRRHFLFVQANRCRYLHEKINTNNTHLCRFKYKWGFWQAVWITRLTGNRENS